MQDTPTFQPEIHGIARNDYDDMASIMKTAESSASNCSNPIEASKDSEIRGAECLNADLDNRIYHKLNLRVYNYEEPIILKPFK